jgi:hypothetical protein
VTSSGWVIPSYTKTLEIGSETEGWLPLSLEASTDALGLVDKLEDAKRRCGDGPKANKKAGLPAVANGDVRRSPSTLERFDVAALLLLRILRRS